MNSFKSTQPNFSYTNERNKRVFMKEFHYHDLHELYFLIEGTTKYIIGDEVFNLQKGNFIFVPKGMPHKTDSENCLQNERILICFDDSAFSNNMLDILNDFSEKKLLTVDRNKLPLLLDILKKIQLETVKKAPHNEAMIKAYTIELLILMSRYLSYEKNDCKEQDKIIYKISEYISNNYHEDIKLCDISRHFSISEGHLSRKFKAVIGTGINEYVRYVRILNAANYLKDESLSITKIAEKCGFNDSNYFSTVFKKSMGITPDKYRKEVNSKDILKKFI